MNLCDQLKQWRLNVGLTQKQVADYLGKDRSAVAYYEAGKVQPNAQAMLTLCFLYRVTAEEMLLCIARSTPRE